ncbi:MAG: hypothetical protein ACRCX2_01105 [Paraclostridium sp.]
MKDIWHIYRYDLMKFIVHYFYREFETLDDTGVFYEIPSHPNKGAKLFFEDFQLEIINLIDEFMKSTSESGLRIAIKSCKGAGKTRLISMIMIWGCMCFEYPKVRGMASTQKQTKDILLASCREILDKANFSKMFQLNKFSYHMIDDDGYPSESNVISGVIANLSNADNVAGDHSASLNLYVIDEASTLDENVYHVLQGIFTSGKSIMILAGNTTDRTSSSIFYKIFNYREYDDFYRFHVPASALKRTRNNNAIERIKSYPPGTEQYKMFVEAEFCDDRDFTFLIESDIQNVLDIKNYQFSQDIFDCNSNCVIGIDMAYGIGRDYTAVVIRCNNQAEVLFYSNMEKPQYMIPKICDWHSRGARIVIDISGIGRDMLSNLRELNIKNIPDIALQSKPLNEDMFVNRKSELLYMTREWVVKNKAFLKTRSTEQKLNFTSECKMLKWNVDEFGKYNLGKKSQNEKSPDLLDALSYTFFYGELTASVNRGQNVFGRTYSRNGFGI